MTTAMKTSTVVTTPGLTSAVESTLVQTTSSAERSTLSITFPESSSLGTTSAETTPLRVWTRPAVADVLLEISTPMTTAEAATSTENCCFCRKYPRHYFCRQYHVGNVYNCNDSTQSWVTTPAAAETTHSVKSTDVPLETSTVEATTSPENGYLVSSTGIVLQTSIPIMTAAMKTSTVVTTPGLTSAVETTLAQTTTSPAETTLAQTTASAVETTLVQTTSSAESSTLSITFPESSSLGTTSDETTPLRVWTRPAAADVLLETSTPMTTAEATASPENDYFCRKYPRHYLCRRYHVGNVHNCTDSTQSWVTTPAAAETTHSVKSADILLETSTAEATTSPENYFCRKYPRHYLCRRYHVGNVHNCTDSTQSWVTTPAAAETTHSVKSADILLETSTAEATTSPENGYFCRKYPRHYLCRRYHVGNVHNCTDSTQSWVTTPAAAETTHSVKSADILLETSTAEATTSPENDYFCRKYPRHYLCRRYHVGNVHNCTDSTQSWVTTPAAAETTHSVKSADILLETSTAEATTSPENGYFCRKYPRLH
ncbi:mucin-17-like [Megalobrama amblycephala]|uniref:mucin-17-like n=1 Tax=Megalobrama amblycephala TaxID=75352 RepID=UPI0020141E41|nr:mucin-17-like [Megalobrama amblycephala]